jgi:hypothetical protein
VCVNVYRHVTIDYTVVKPLIMWLISCQYVCIQDALYSSCSPLDMALMYVHGQKSSEAFLLYGSHSMARSSPLSHAYMFKWSHRILTLNARERCEILCSHGGNYWDYYLGGCTGRYCSSVDHCLLFLSVYNATISIPVLLWHHFTFNLLKCLSKCFTCH